jgi:hypothetical protein
MNSISGYILRLSHIREELLEDTEEDYFAEPVNDFNHSRNIPLICFVFSNSGMLTWIANAKRGVRAGTGLRRLNIDDFYDVSDESVDVDEILELSAPRFKAKLQDRLQNGGLLPPKTFQDLIRVLSQLAPEAGAVLSGYSETRQKRIGSLSTEARKMLGEQKEAVATAMTIAGIDRSELLNWDISESEAPQSFLDGLSQVRLREDPMVINDAQVLPGFDAIGSTPFNSVVFEDDQRKLTVLITNRQPLEEQLGVDLIYYNETFQSFLLIQYKAMENEGTEAIYRFPNKQLTAEINRMQDILSELGKCAANDEADGYRLSENPFFLKLCQRIVFNPDNVGLVKGMYLPLDYWNLISEHESMKGPKSGKRIAYSNARRYFGNTDFTNIAANAWVGTTIKQSSELTILIRSTLESGRTVVFAVANDKERRHHART